MNEGAWMSLKWCLFDKQKEKARSMAIISSLYTDRNIHTQDTQYFSLYDKVMNINNI